VVPCVHFRLLLRVSGYEPTLALRGSAGNEARSRLRCGCPHRFRQRFLRLESCERVSEREALFSRGFHRRRGSSGRADRRGLRCGRLAREALSLSPLTAPWQANLARALTGLNRFAEAKETCERALDQHLDATVFHTLLYQIAFVGGDTSVMQQQITWASGKPDEYIALDWQAGAAAFAAAMTPFGMRLEVLDGAAVGSAAAVKGTYEWTYLSATSHLSPRPTAWCLRGTSTCAQFFGGVTSSDSNAVMWQFSGGGGFTNGVGDFDQIDVARMP